MMRWLKAWWRQRRVKRCQHPRWEVLKRSNDIWWRAFFTLEFCRSDGKPQEEGFGEWHQARLVRCPLCGGVLDEIRFGENALGEKEWVKLWPEEYKKYLQGCGDIS